MTQSFQRVSLGALLFALGCTSHYRDALLAYRAGEPVPFVARTLAWAGDVDVTEADVSEVAPVIERTTEVQAPEDRAGGVAAHVLGVSREWLDMQAARLTHPDTSMRGPLSWETLAVGVAMMNPGVAAARNQWLATIKQYDQAEFLEGLLREYQSFTRYLDTGAGSAMNRAMPGSYFPYPNSIALKGEMLREQVRLAELEWERVLRDALVRAGELYFSYQFQFRGAAAVGENVSLLEDLVDVVQDRYATGLATQPDVLRLQTALERQRNLLLDFHAQQRSDAAAINAILGRAVGAELGGPTDRDHPAVPVSRDELVDTARRTRQETLEQEARVARTQIAIRMGEIMNRPLASQGFSLFDPGMADPVATPGSMSFGVKPSAPAIPTYAQAEAYLAEMRSRLEAERQLLQQAIADTGALAVTMLEQVDVARRHVDLVRDVVLPLEQSAYDIALRAYTAGELTFIDLLDAESRLIETRLELVANLRDLNQALVRLATVRGVLAGLD